MPNKKEDARRKREAEALRANLAKRKEQQRRRQTHAENPENKPENEGDE